MIVTIEVRAEEKVAARSQFEPNLYSAAVTVQNLEIQDLGQVRRTTDRLFAEAKAAIAEARAKDGLGTVDVTVSEAGRNEGAGEPVVAKNRIAEASETKRNGKNGVNGHAVNGAEAAKISPKQLAFIGDLAKEVGLDRSELDAICRRAVGQKLSAALSRFDASRIIGLLQDVSSGKVRREEVLS